MSSFDALMASDAKHPDGFLPLCPAGATEAEPRAEAWRPLFDAPASLEEPLPPTENRGPDGDTDATTEDGRTSMADGEGTSFAAGYEQGQRDTRALVENVGAALAQSVAAIEEFRKELRERYAEELLEVALSVARKVLHSEVSERPELWLSMIQKAVDRVVSRETVRIRVPGALAAFLTEYLPDLRARLDGVQELEIIEDPALGEGACVIESQFAELDAGLDVQVGAIRRALTSDPS